MTIQLFVDDEAVLSSLVFSLAVEGLPVRSKEAALADGRDAAAVVIDRGTLRESLACLTQLRAAGYGAAVIVLATHPNARQRAQVAAAGAVLIEKPLLGDELTSALRAALSIKEAA